MSAFDRSVDCDSLTLSVDRDNYLYAYPNRVRFHGGSESIDQRRWIHRSIEESKNTDEFPGKVDKEAWLKRDGNLVYSTFDSGRCVCPIVGKLPLDRLPAEWCNCQAGYVKALFEDVLKQPVKVELPESLRSGAGQCRFRIEL